MSEHEHSHHSTERLATLSLGALDQQETGEAHAQVESCPECRAIFDELTEMTDVLDEIPPEMFLDGPPDGGDLLLQRTLRQVRTESRRRGLTSRFVVAAAVAAGIAIVLGGGVLIGRSAVPGPSAPAIALPAPGTRFIAGTDGPARITAQVTPEKGWVRVHAAVYGIPPGQKCDLLVVSKNGQTEIASSWLVSAKLSHGGVQLDGSALVDPGQVASVQVRSTDGRTFVTAQE